MYKAPGAWYTVVLRTREFSHAHNFATGAFGTPGRMPAPDFGTRCVCCDSETRERRSYDPSSDRVRVEPIAIPLCGTCAGHVKTDTNGVRFAAATLLAAIAGGLLMASKGETVIAGACAVIALVAALWFWRVRAKRIVDSDSGHHTGLEISGMHGICRVRTTNRRLAVELAERNKAILKKAV